MTDKKGCSVTGPTTFATKLYIITLSVKIYEIIACVRRR
jgi:hypothetical protein